MAQTGPQGSELREEAVDIGFGPPPWPAGTSDFQVVVQGQIWEDAPSLIHVSQPAAGNAEGRLADQFFSPETYATLTGPGEADEAPQSRSLASAVAPQQANDFTFVHVQTYPLQDMAVPIEGMHIACFEHLTAPDRLHAPVGRPAPPLALHRQ